MKDPGRPDEPPLDFDDPLQALPEDARHRLRQDLPTLFAHLDRLWDAGTLPQTVRR